MSMGKIVSTIGRPGIIGKWLRVMILSAVMSIMTLIGVVTSASADGATQISGLGNWPVGDECSTPPDGQYYDYSFKMAGDLEGCVYVTVETAECSPSGTYRETGSEFYQIDGGTQGVGTFISLYRVTGKFEGCLLDNPLAVEIFGRCQHPILAGSGTGDFEGVTGRLDFKDDIEAGNFPYRGHLKW